MTESLLSAIGDELLDHPDADGATVERSLRGIARANVWFGGWWAVRRGLELVVRRLSLPRAERGGGSGAALDGSVVRWFAGSTEPQWPPRLSAGHEPPALTLLDIGCGAGDLAARAVRWGRRRGVTLIPIGLERHRAGGRLTYDRDIPSVIGCAGELPFREKSVDIIVASQLVHHFSRQAIVAFCQAADRVARRGVVIADLRRSSWALAAFQVGARLIALDTVTRVDGLTSIRRGFTRAELASLLAAGGVRAHVEHTSGFRLVAAWLSADQ
jgi:SAM-dependent methyltransferase